MYKTKSQQKVGKINKITLQDNAAPQELIINQSQSSCLINETEVNVGYQFQKGCFQCLPKKFIETFL